MSNIEETNPFELIDVEYSNEEYDSQEENYTEEEEEVSEDNEDIEGEETDEHQERDEYEEEYDDEEESNSYIVLQEYIDKGLIQAPENINKNLSGEELIEILNNNANAAQRAILEEEYTNAGYNEDIKKGIEFLRAGGSIEELQLLYSNESLSELDIEDDYNLENREKLIKAYYKDKGIPDDKIDSLYSLSLENDETLKDAETAKSYFKEKDSYILEKQREEKRLAEEEELRNQEESKKQVEKILNSGNLLNIGITKTEADNIMNSLYNTTETISYKDNNGNVRSAKVTKYQVLMNEYSNNVEWQLMFAKLLLDKFDFTNLKNKIKTERDIETLDSLNSRLNNKKAIGSKKFKSGSGTGSNIINVRDISI